VPTTLGEVNATGMASREVLKSQAVAHAEPLLDDHLVTTLGCAWIRFPRARQAVNNSLTEYPLPDGHYFAKAPSRNRSTTGSGMSASLPRRNFASQGNQELCAPCSVGRTRSCGCRPASPERSYNDSQIFTPAGKRVTAFNEPIDPPRGTTRNTASTCRSSTIDSSSG